MDYRVISIGALSRHELWQETAAVRTPHATTTLIRSGKHVIVVDPGLPGQVVASRLGERAGIKAEAVTDVFLTDFRPAHRWGLDAFPRARWLISEMEREAAMEHLREKLLAEEDADAVRLLERDQAILERCQVAPDRLAGQVDLFPLPGFTAGTCGLLLSQAQSTILVAGDGVATSEHLEQGRVLPGCYDAQQAMESLREALEIADIIVPGHDNLIVNPTRRPM